MKKKFWIAVGEDGETYLHSTKPTRCFSFWRSHEDESEEIYVKDVFSHLNLTWESEPYEIEI